MAATAPTKGEFKAEAPEWSGMLALGASGESDDLPSLRNPAVTVGAAFSDSRRAEMRALFQVFLI
ncbi:MAG: hypothetical protein HRU46_04220 [Verrucomicrobiales bacterium]|nr:hypothetical protein [Verrucomicrobiales bacterium]